MHQSVNDVISITVGSSKPGNVVHGETVNDKFEFLDMVMDRSANFYNIKSDLRGFVYELWKWLDRLENHYINLCNPGLMNTNKTGNFAKPTLQMEYYVQF